MTPAPSWRAHWNPIKSETAVLHLGAWGFDQALSSAATTLTRNTVIGGRFNGALRVSTGTLTGGTGTTGYGIELGGYREPLWVMGEAGRRSARLGGDIGAIELTARYESLDYSDLLSGGEGWAATLGVNWYLNSFTRFQLDAIQ